MLGTLADPYRNITEVPEGILESLSEASDARWEDAERSGLRKKVLKEALQGLCGGSSTGAVVLDVGCGNGSLALVLAKTPNISQVIGVDPSPFFLAKARASAADEGLEEGKLEFVEADSMNLGFVKDGSVDLVLFIDVLTHLPAKHIKPSLLEANRVLRAGGRILLQDKDLASWCLTFGPTDILTAPVETMLGAWSEGKYLCRQYHQLLEAAGFVPQPMHFFPVLDCEEDTYGYNYVLLRAIRIYERAGKCSAEAAEAMREEASRRIKNKTFQCLLVYGFCAGYKRAVVYDSDSDVFARDEPAYAC